MARITKTMFKKAIEGTLGTQREVARALDVSDSAIHQYLARNPDMASVLEFQRMKNVESAELELFSQLDFQDDRNRHQAANIRQKASQYILGRLGKSKGWVEKTEQEIEHKGIEQLKVIIEERQPDGQVTNDK